jgi:hypothetical protein
MDAHSWALCCLVTVISSPAIAGDTRVEILLRTADVVPDLILSEMKSEVGSLMEPAGYQIEWSGAHASTKSFKGALVVVELRGSCERPSPSLPQPGVVQLGSSAVADGKVLPFSWADCTALAQFLEPSLTHKQKQQREFVFGRAMARVVAHELYHMLGHTLAHTKSGLMKARFQPSDLLDERAEFGNASMARLQTPRTLEGGP